MCLSNWLVFSSPACKVLNKFLIYQSFLKSGHYKNKWELMFYKVPALHIFTLFPAQEFLTPLENVFWPEFLFNDFVTCCVTEKFSKSFKDSCSVWIVAVCGLVFCTKLTSTQAACENFYLWILKLHNMKPIMKEPTPASASLGFLFSGLKKKNEISASKFLQIQVFYAGLYCTISSNYILKHNWKQAPRKCLYK